MTPTSRRVQLWDHPRVQPSVNYLQTFARGSRARNYSRLSGGVSFLQETCVLTVERVLADRRLLRDEILPGLLAAVVTYLLIRTWKRICWEGPEKKDLNEILDADTRPCTHRIPEPTDWICSRGRIAWRYAAACSPATTESCRLTHHLRDSRGSEASANARRVTRVSVSGIFPALKHAL